MKDEIKVWIVNKDTKKELSCPIGSRIDSLVHHFDVRNNRLAAVKANGEILSLSAKLEVNTVLEPVSLESPEGEAIYRCTLAFLLADAAGKLFLTRAFTSAIHWETAIITPFWKAKRRIKMKSKNCKTG